MNPTQVFQSLSQTEPFFTVSSARRYRRKRIDDDNERRFWQEGRDCIDYLLGCVGPHRFGSVLDYGCGVGRLLRCMAPQAELAYGVDICPSLLARACQVCPDAVLKEYSQWLGSAPLVDFSYSVIVFQHIPEAQGLAILQRLLKYTRQSCAFHIVVGDRRPSLLKSLFALSFRAPFAGVSNWLRGRRWGEPRIPMFCWSREKVEALFRCEGFVLTLHDLPDCVESFWESYLFVGRRAS